MIMSEAILRKRPRPPKMTRTTSIKQFSPPAIPSEIEECNSSCMSSAPPPVGFQSAREPHVKSAEDSARILHFLHHCGVCRRPLGSGKDIYIYRGDSAFCSNECREQHIKHDALSGSSTSC